MEEDGVCATGVGGEGESEGVEPDEVVEGEVVEGGEVGGEEGEEVGRGRGDVVERHGGEGERPEGGRHVAEDPREGEGWEGFDVDLREGEGVEGVDGWRGDGVRGRREGVGELEVELCQGEFLEVRPGEEKVGDVAVDVGCLVEPVAERADVLRADDGAEVVDRGAVGGAEKAGAEGEGGGVRHPEN